MASRHLGTIAAIAILGLLAFAGVTYLFTPAPPEPSPPVSEYESQAGVGKRLPALELEPLTGDGEPVNLEKLAGRVVVVNFWGAWCGPCRREFPELADLYDKLRENPKFRLLAVSCAPPGAKEEPRELWAQTREFLSTAHRDMPTYSDPNETTRTAFDRVAGLYAFPTTFVMDGDGLIRGVWTGYGSQFVREIKDLVERLLQGGEPAKPPSI